LSFSALKESL
jgi:hypothetical protein